MQNALLQYIQLYKDHKAAIDANSPELLNLPREQALDALVGAMLPVKGDEGYPALSINDMFMPDYGVNINRVAFPADLSDTFRCGVPNISTLLALVVNDEFRATAGLARNLPQGVEVKSLAEAARDQASLIADYYNSLPTKADKAAALNTLLVQDGVFVHIKKGVKLDKPLQVVNVFNAIAPVMGVRRLLVLIDDDASASLLVCDHSVRHDVQYLSNQVVEIFLGKNASFDFYDLEESSNATSRHSSLYVRQQEGSRLVANGTTLMGGKTRNNYYVEHTGQYAETKLVGMAVGSGEQIIDNSTFVSHKEEKCNSDQMFKYILDEKSQGAFYGLIVVDEKAKFTKAYQSNRNVLASADARMYTRPQLEIYCDEVKCSHGATVGQLDANALFYMRQRGIPESEAKMMLMQAFMSDVIDTVTIPALKSRLSQLVEQRLAGEHRLCADCTL